MEEKKYYLDEINLHCLAVMLLKNLWVVVLLCASVLLCYSAVSKLTYTPKFTSTATFMVSAKDSTSAYNSLTTTQSMASVFVEVFQSNVLREKIQSQMPEEQFDGAISTTTIPETNLLIVTVTSSAPDMSFKALSLAVENYGEISEYLFSNAQLEVIKDPAVPVVPSNPLELSTHYPVLLVLTAALSVAGLVFLWMRRDTVQTPKAARRKIDARLVRTIHHEEKNKTLRSKYLRKNIAPLIVNALISKSFIEDNLSLCSALEYHMRRRGQRVVMITSMGENEGKSTVAANLALSLARKNKRVVLLDCDFRKPSLHKIFELPVQKEQTLSAFLQQHSEAPAPYLTDARKYGITLGLSQPSHKHISELINNGMLRALLQRLRTQADYVILDTPPMLVAADAEAIAAMADTALMITRADLMPAASINDGLDRLRKSAPEVCGIVLNNYRKTILQ